MNSEKCAGVAGLIFGHHYEVRRMTIRPDAEQIALINNGADTEACADLAKLYNPPRYLGDVCRRCGQFKPHMTDAMLAYERATTRT